MTLKWDVIDLGVTGLASIVRKVYILVLTNILMVSQVLGSTR